VKTTSSLKIDESNIKLIAKNLQSLLNAYDISEYRVSQDLNIPAMTIRRLVSGETTDPRISTINKIANYFNVSLDSIVNSKEESNIRIMKKTIPQFVPIIEWDIVKSLKSIHELDLSSWDNWQPVLTMSGESISSESYALKSKISMQPRFPQGSIFIIDPKENPSDNDLILVKMQNDENLSLRQLFIESPMSILQPVITGSEPIPYQEKVHKILGVVIYTVFNSRKNKTLYK